MKILSLINSFANSAIKSLSLNVPLHLKCVAPLSCETCTSVNSDNRKRVVITNKSQGSVATDLRCVGMFNNDLIVNLLTSLSVCKF